MRSTHTYAVMEVSEAAFREIEEKLRDAGYTWSLHDGTLDMHGIALQIEAPERRAQRIQAETLDRIREALHTRKRRATFSANSA